MTLTLNERRYLVGRLQEIGVNIDGMHPESHVFPIIIADDDILALFRKHDERMVEFISTHSRPMLFDGDLHEAAITRLATGLDVPVKTLTWRRANLREVWAWVGIGAGGILALQLIAGVIFGIVRWVA